MIKTILNKICAFGQSISVGTFQRFWATGSQRYLSIFGMMVVFVIFAIVEAIPPGAEPFSWIWEAYKEFVGRYISLNDKEVIASAIAVVLIVADYIRQPVLWILFTIEGLTKRYSPSAFERRAEALMRIPVGEYLRFILKVIVASAIFWYFQR